MTDDESMEEGEEEATAMQNALIAAGTHREATKGFVKFVMTNSMPGTSVELYGRGAIVQNANKQRRRLNVEGHDAFDLQTTKPNGQP